MGGKEGSRWVGWWWTGISRGRREGRIAYFITHTRVCLYVERAVSDGGR